MMRSHWLRRCFGRPSGGEQSTPWRRQRARAADYAACFSTPAGRRVLADLAERCHLLTGLATLHDDGLMAALEAARREGRRGVVLDILDLLGWTPARLVADDEDSERSDDDGYLG